MLSVKDEVSNCHTRPPINTPSKLLNFKAGFKSDAIWTCTGKFRPVLKSWWAHKYGRELDGQAGFTSHP
jgi:hypothetical protein